MNFTVINESFQCQQCKKHVSALKGTCRNHCNYCLYSKHLDSKNPGDRASRCHGLMMPVGVKYNGKKGWMLLHKCQICKHEMYNKSADDDNFEKIIQLSSQI